MALYLTSMFAARQPADSSDNVVVAEPANWWTSFLIGETAGIDWLWLLGGVLFFCMIGYGLYSIMLYNQIVAIRHPANFRKIILSLVLLLSILWFTYVFFRAYGGMILLTLVVAWLVLVTVFIVTRRKVSA